MKMDNATLKIAYTEIPELVHFDEKTKKIEGKVAEFLELLTTPLKKNMGFNFEYVRMADYLAHFESFKNNETDITLDLTNALIDRMDYIEYTNPLMYDSFFIYSGYPVRSSGNHFSSIAAFNNEVWLCLLLLWFVTPLILVWSRYAFVSALEVGKEYLRELARLSVLLLNQSIGKKGFVFWGTWSVGAFIINSAFLGLLLSKMAVPEVPVFVETFKDVLQHPTMRIYTLIPKLLIPIFQIRDPKISDQLENRLTNIFYPDTIGNLVDGMFKILNGLPLKKGCYAASELAISFFLDLTDSCEEMTPHMYSSKNPYTGLHLSLPIRKSLNRSVVSQLNAVCDYAMAGGLLSQITDKTVKNRKRCFLNPYNTFESGTTQMKIEMYVFPLLVLATGIGLSSAVFILEHIFPWTIPNL